MLGCWLILWFDIVDVDAQASLMNWTLRQWLVCCVFVVLWCVVSILCIMHSTHRYTRYINGHFPGYPVSTSTRLSNHVVFWCSRWWCKWQVKTRNLKNTLHRGYISCSLITNTSVQTQSFPAGCLSCHSTNWTDIVKALNDGHYAHHCVQKLCWEKKFSMCVDVLEITI